LKDKIYFASDFHLGAPTYEKSLVREKLIVQWLNDISADASEVFLVGDIFDFWFEYKQAIPRGFTRILGKLAELSDSGIQIHLFTGNHDMWIFDYLPHEINAILYREPISIKRQGLDLYIGHGDGLGPGDYGYKFIKSLFSNKLCQWMFARLHPNFGIGLANYLSRSSRAKTGESDSSFLGNNEEWLALYSKEILNVRHYDLFIFGHRHLPLEIALNEKSTYFNLGDWINYYSYGELHDGKFQLKYYNES
jgi:UDP-2,3-diacylglucosamine hydrolase